MLRGAHIYFGEVSKPAIVAALHYNDAGIVYEQEAPLLVANWREPVLLAQAVRSAIDRFSKRDRNLRNHKLKDWPSYRVSDSDSVRDFEEKCLCVHVRALNEQELFYDVYCQPRGETEISLHVTVNRHGKDAEIGRKILKVLDSCSDWLK